MVPEFDQDRVYVSDIKKMVSWYNTLLDHGLLDFTEEIKEPETGETSPEVPPKAEDEAEAGN